MSTDPSSKVPGVLYEWTGTVWCEWTGGRGGDSRWPFAPEISLLTYNVWAEQTYAVERATAIIAHIARLCPDVVGLQEVSRDEYGEPAFWDVFHQNPLIRSEYLISTLEEQNDLVFDSEAPFVSIMIVRRAFVARVSQISLWYYGLKSRDRGSSLMAVDLYDASGLRLTIATGRFESEQSLYGRSVRAEQFEEALSALSTSRNLILMGDFGVTAEDELYPFFASSYVDIWNACHPTGGPWRSSTYGGFGFVEFPLPQKRAEYRRTDLVLARGEWYTGGSAQLVGNTPLKEGPHAESFVNERGRPLVVYASSHLGVSANLTLEREATERMTKRARRH